MVLHFITSLMFVFLLAGTTIIVSKTNSSNELILLVDKSDTSNISEKKRDDLVETIVDYAKFDGIKVGIVTFGYDQEYAVPLTREYGNIMSLYDSAPLPDITATNINQALLYARDKFSSDATGKIVIISDFKETDESVRSTIKSVIASGIRVDTAYIDTSLDEEEKEYEIIGVTLPDTHINKGDSCTIAIDIVSNQNSDVSVTFKDNGSLDEDSTIEVQLSPGMQTVTFNHTFSTDGLHELEFEIDNSDDFIKNNNKYISYMNIESFNKLLILEHRDDSSLLKAILTQNERFEVEVLNTDFDEIPDSAKKLCAYDEVILNNIANEDLPEGFPEILKEYVSEYGGGLFTVGGNNDNGEAHAYNRSDLSGTILQQLLPVQAIDYTPPLGVIIIIDRSGSMGGSTEGQSALDWARTGAFSCLSVLSERDYIGIMTLDSDYSTILELTPRIREDKIIPAIDSIQTATGGTVFPGAIERAGLALRALKSVDKKHIIIVSDGQVPDGEVPDYEALAKDFYEKDRITISMVGVNFSSVPANHASLESDEVTYDKISPDSPYLKMLRLTKIGHGRLYVVNNDNMSQLAINMREDLNAKDLKEVSDEAFSPIASIASSNVFKNVELVQDGERLNTLPFELGGFYGVKVRPSADLIMTGEFNEPIYAMWKYGKGTVASFKSDLNGDFSSDMLSSTDGVNVIYNMINSVTPVKSLRLQDIELVLREDNFSNYMSIYTTLKEGERLEGEIKYKTAVEDIIVSLNSLPQERTNEALRELAAYVDTPLSKDTGYSRCRFVIKKPGTYEIVIKKIDSEDKVLSQRTIYKSLAYSKEYDLQNDGIDYALKAEEIAKLSTGDYVLDLNDPHEITDSFKSLIYKEYDPRMVFAIIAIITFLLDLFVRKFKFSWPHEIIRKYMKKNR